MSPESDQQVAETLKGWARRAFPQSMNNSFSMNSWVQIILDLMRTVDPAEYAEVHADLFPAEPASFRGEE